jgi:hypothetical protein
MPNPKAPRFLLDVRNEASGYLGRELTDSEWAEAYPPAAQKLSRIIQLYGDNGGARSQPWYLGKLVQEHIAFSVLSTYCAMSAQKKTASEEDGLLTTTNITLNTIQCQS